MTLIPETNNNNEIPVPENNAVVKLDLKSACDAMMGLCQEVWPDGKLGRDDVVPENNAGATLDLKSACDAMLDICNEVWPDGKLGPDDDA